MNAQKTIGAVLKRKDDQYTIVASSNDVDRDNEIILPSAFKNLKNYLSNNPVILGFHDYWSFPIGKAKSGKTTDSQLILEIEFAETEKGKEAKYLYDNGFMNSFSVGFIPKEWDHDKDGRRVYTDVELLEVSAVPVPANAAANILRSVKGVKLPTIEAIARGDEPEDRNEEAEAVAVPKKRKWYEKIL